MLVLAVAAWGILSASHNLHAWSGTLGAVGAVSSMSTFEGGADSWQAVSSPVLNWLGALFIVVSKIVAGVLCFLGGRQMWRHRAASREQFARSKQLALAGCGMAIFMLFSGFIVIAEVWFELWQSDAMRGPVLDSAFRYSAMITLIAIFVGANND